MTEPVEPLEPAYGWTSPGEPVELLAGNGSLDSEDVGRVRVWVDMRRDPGVRWERTDDDHTNLDLGRRELRVPHSRLGFVSVPVQVSHGAGRGHVFPTDLSAGQDIDRVVVHWANVPNIQPSAPLRSGPSLWSGRWFVEVAGWSLTVDSRYDLSETLRTAKDTDEEFAITHVGELRRTDGTAFDAETAKTMLTGWQIALSFALSRWVAPVAPVGYDAAGTQVWEQWGPWRCDTLTGYESWCSANRTEDLSDLVIRFVAAFLDPEEGGVVRHLAMHAVAAQHAGTTTEAKVMLAQAGLEYLAWVDRVLNGHMSKRKFREAPAERHLRDLLTTASVPTEAPPELEALRGFAQVEGCDTPTAVVRLRNKLVHPKDAREPYRIEGLLWQASRLTTEWLELCLLHRIGYEGGYSRRYPPGRSAAASEPVPWTQPRP